MYKALKFLSGGWLEWLLKPGMAQIEPGTAIALMAGTGLLGSLIGGNATAKAQAAANATNERIANQTNTTNQQNYLLQRGVSSGAIPGIAAGNVNTQLPLWATIDRQPAEQALFNQIIGIGQSGAVDVNNPSSYASINQVREYLAANPEEAAGIQAMLTQTGDTRDPVQWLHDHTTTTEQDDGGGQFTTKLKAFAQKTNAALGTGIPSQYQDLQNAAVNAAGRIYNGGFLTDEMNALAPALDARLRLGELEMERNAELRGKTKNIYDAELLQADTYGQAALEAVNRVLAQQAAKNATRGYSGGSSMDDLVAARTLAPAVQAGAGVRAQAGVNYQTRLASILDAEAKKVSENAKIQNAIDRLGLISGDITRQLGGVNLPGQLFQQQTSLGQLAEGQKYASLDAMLSRLNALNTGGQVQAPQQVVPQVGSVLNSGQIAGSALSSLAGMGMDYFTSQSLIKALNANNAMKGGLMSTTPAAGAVLGAV